MRVVSTRVLPVPAPASTSTGPSGVSTATRCSGLRPVQIVRRRAARAARAAMPPAAGRGSGTPRWGSLLGSVMLELSWPHDGTVRR